MSEKLNALLFNCSLTLNEEASHTRLLLSSIAHIFQQNDVNVEHLHVGSYQIAHGMGPDMTQQGHLKDDWPAVWERVRSADILVLGTPIWLGEESSYCRKVIERLYAMSDQLNDKGQSIYYNKVGGAAVTGNEDGVKHVSMSLIYALQHMGFTIPPQADCGWTGEAGPGPSYGDVRKDAPPVGYDNAFTQQNTTIMAWNLMHMARLLKKEGGLPTQGNDREAWKAGERFGYQPPDDAISAG